jgi:uncharacterized protein
VELLPRHIRPEAEDALRHSRVVAIVGPRQAGKSTLATQLAREVMGVPLSTLDDDATRAFAQADPGGFVASLPSPAAIDEVQRAPALMLAIKRVVDRDNQPGRFLITGSADLRVLPTIPDALPGRVEYLSLWPLSQGEITGVVETFLDDLRANRPPQLSNAPIGLARYADRLVIGGFPGVLEAPPRRRTGFFASYVDTLLGQSLTDVADLRDPAAVTSLLSLLAARSGSLTNLSALGAELRLDAKTVARHITLLVQLGLLIRLPAWYTNLGQRIVKAPKLHLADSGLLVHLTGANSERLTRDPILGGTVLETFVLNELVRQAGWADDTPAFHHFRSREGGEIDIVLQWRDGTVAGVEVKSAASVGPKDFRALAGLRDRLGDRFASGVVLYTGEQTLPAGERLWAVPLQALWTRQHP